MAAEAASVDVDAARGALAAWYARHRRALPWRVGEGSGFTEAVVVDDGGGDARAPEPGPGGGPRRRRPGHPDPYAVWISEVMLQQTQVATATPFFRRWMARFPDVATLAAADLDDVLACWQGLGYYARARNLHRAARAVVAAHGGRLPDDVDALRRLPGIGDYTAGAIASIAFGRRVPAVDGNARRVLARLGAVPGDPARGAAAAAIHALATRLADAPAPGDVNQALMELGATICVPRAPRCGACPVAGHCRAFAAGRAADFPMTAARARPGAAHVLALALRRPHGAGSDRWLVARRPEHGLLGGLWEFPLVDAAPDDDPATACRAALGLAPVALVRGPVVGHAFTHLRLSATVVVGDVSDVRATGGGGDGGGDGGAPPSGAAAGVAQAPAAASPVHRLAAAYTAWRWVPWSDLGGDGLPTSSLMVKLAAAAEAVRPRAASPPAG